MKSAELQCPGLNNDSPFIDDPDYFCSNAENEDFNELTKEKIYNFLKKEDFFYCKEISNIFNYFLLSSTILKLNDSPDFYKKYLDLQFIGYSGLGMSILNESIHEKV